MATNNLLEVPPTGISFTPPPDYVPESEKTVSWFTDYARWIINTFYNSKRQPFYNGEVVRKGVAEESIENWAYVFAAQQNINFSYMQQDFQGNSIPAVWISGGKIGELYNHLKGRIIEDISNIEISAQNLSRDAASKRSELIEKLRMKVRLQNMGLAMTDSGVQYNPGSALGVDVNSMEDVEEFISKWQDEYSIICEKMARNIVEYDYLKNKFISVAQDQLVSGLSGMLTQVVNGRIVNEHIPTHKLIWDNRIDDDFNENAWVCGILDNKIPYQKIIEMFGKELGTDAINEIRAMSDPRNVQEAQIWANYYNTGNGIPLWWSDWSTADMCVSYARLWWIGPRDYRYMKTRNRYGVERYKKINDDEYYTVTQEDGKPKKLKGSDIPGDFVGYDIHTCVIIGNKYVVQHGYANNVVRPVDKMEKPILPIHIYCNNMALGGNRSIVSRLRKHQDELDRLAWKIQDITAKAAGKVFIINGSKLDVTSTEMLSDFKIMGLHVSKGASGEADDIGEGQRMVEVVDMTLDPNIVRYIELRNEQKMEMEEIASVSKIALGQQQNVVGKGVQMNTVNQNSYGTAGLFYGLMKYFEKILQHSVNLQQMLWASEESVEEVLILGDSGSELLSILDPQEFGTQKLKVLIKLNDFMDSMQKERIKSIALAQAQNGAISAIDYIEHIELAKSPTESIKGLKQSQIRQEKKIMQQQAGAQQAQMQHEANMQQSKQMFEAAILQLKESNENYRKELDVLKDNLEEIKKQMQAAPPPSPLSVTLDQQTQQALAEMQQIQQQQQMMQQMQDASMQQGEAPMEEGGQSEQPMEQAPEIG